MSGNSTRANEFYQRGMAALREASLLEAARLFQQVVQLEPQNAEFLVHATEVFRRAAWLKEAVVAGQKAVEFRPDLPAAYNNLGLALFDSGQRASAEAAFRQAIALDPQYAKAFHNLGNVLRHANRLDESAEALQRAIALRPDYPQALNGLGLVLKQMHQHDRAIRYLRSALKLRPDYPQALLNLGNTLSEIGLSADGEAYLRRALSIDANYAQAWHDLGALVEGQRRLTEAAAAYENALRINPDVPAFVASLENARRHLCDWTDQSARIERLLKLVDDCLAKGELSPLWPAASIRFPTTNPQRLAIAERYASHITSSVTHNDAKTKSAAPPEVITVGFLSHEFGDFIVSYLMQSFYGRFDRSRFRVCGFAYSPDDGSNLRRRITQECDEFIDVSAHSPKQAAQRIAAEGVDILFDLNSYMPGGRPEIAAQRPAPVQVNYRYPATMGAEWIDYILADRVVVPERDQQYTEQPVYLPDCYLVTSFDNPVAADGTSRADWGLPDDVFVFCSFNQAHKLDPQIFDVWMRILHSVPKSVLWQIEENKAVRNNLRGEAHCRGIDPARLIFAEKLPIQNHLARFRHADLFLDCLVHGAVVTAADALWAGLPLLTVLGDTFTSRAAASLVTAAGLPELVVSDLAEYEELAVRLTQSPSELDALRRKLSEGRDTSPLFDTGRFVRNLELALAEMWRLHLEGQRPRPIDVAALAAGQRVV